MSLLTWPIWYGRRKVRLPAGFSKSPDRFSSPDRLGALWAARVGIGAYLSVSAAGEQLRTLVLVAV
jgi:hypothetical protein